MIGDRLDNDILPAKALGMKTIWIKQGVGGQQLPISEEYEPDFQIDSLDALTAILPSSSRDPAIKEARPCANMKH